MELVSPRLVLLIEDSMLVAFDSVGDTARAEFGS